jgi:antitoxin (DNA-binding transcriptional repressor) of toxin-antitoxin stability system
MSRKTIGTTEARERLSHVLNEVAYGGRRYIVERISASPYPPRQ